MDFISHALWGGVSFGRAGKKKFLMAAGISIVPDLFTEGLFFILLVFGIGGMPGWENGHPNISDYPIFAQYLYNVTHSLIVFAAIFILLSILIKRPVWLIAAWGLHVLIDIPTHSLALFPTPFLWPVSDLKINGIGWDSPTILLTDIVLLTVFYGLWIYNKHRRRSPSATPN